MSIITPQHTIATGSPILLLQNNIIGFDHGDRVVSDRIKHGALSFSTIHAKGQNYNADEFHPVKTVTPINWRIMPLDSLDNPETPTEGAVFYNDDTSIVPCQYIVYNPNFKDMPYSLNFQSDWDIISTGRECIGVLDLDLLNSPRKIQTPEEFEAFLPNYDRWLQKISDHDHMLPQKQRTLFNGLRNHSCRDQVWFKREFARTFAPNTFGSYRKQPTFVIEEFYEQYDLFPYMSTSSPGQMAYQPPEDNYRDGDRQIRTKPGRFLNKYFTLTSDQVRGAVSEVNTDQAHNLKFATTKEEFEYVYLNGPSSCMTHSIDWYGSSQSTGRLPISVLANGDIKVAYIELDSGTIPARALVVDSSKEYIEIYQNNDAMDGARYEMESYLEAAGYTRNSEGLIDQTIEKLETPEGDIVCPYIDCGGLMVNMYGDHLVITGQDDGEYQPNYESGVLGDGEPTFYCNNCEEDRPEEDENGTWEDGSVCDSCLEGDYIYAYVNDRSDEMGYIRDNETVYVNGTYYSSSQDVLDYHEIGLCMVDNEHHNFDELTYCEVDEQYIHQAYAVYLQEDEININKDYAVYSNSTCEWILEDTAIAIDGEYYHPDNDDIVQGETGTWMLLDTQTPLSLSEINAA